MIHWLVKIIPSKSGSVKKTNLKDSAGDYSNYKYFIHLNAHITLHFFCIHSHFPFNKAQKSRPNYYFCLLY